MNYVELKNKIKQLFIAENIDDYADIDWIMVEILNTQRSMLQMVREISKSQEDAIMNAVQKRLKHIPIAYIFGKTNFYGYDLKVNQNVLIPRLDTEVLVEEIVRFINSKPEKLSVLDIGTGSGAIIIAINKETDAKCYAVDISENAIEIAKENAMLNSAKVEFKKSNLFDQIEDLKVDIIVSNPPYIETDVVKTLDKEVLENEPILALDGGEDGLDFYRKIVLEAKQHLNAGGMIYFEIGYNQGENVSKLLADDFEKIEVIKDYGGNDRVVKAKLKG